MTKDQTLQMFTYDYHRTSDPFFHRRARFRRD